MKTPPNYYREKLKVNAERMRLQPTPAEAIFRDRLKATGVEFLSQVVIGCYIADFVLPTKMIIYELDGRGHSLPTKVAYDQKRTEFLKDLGFKVRRIRNSDAADYPLRRVKFKNQAKKDAFPRAVQEAKRLVAEYAKLKGDRHERVEINRGQERMVAANAQRPVRLIKGGELIVVEPDLQQLIAVEAVKKPKPARFRVHEQVPESIARYLGRIG